MRKQPPFAAGTSHKGFDPLERVQRVGPGQKRLKEGAKSRCNTSTTVRGEQLKRKDDIGGQGATLWPYPAVYGPPGTHEPSIA
mmetsp:Transcript_8277/g.51575  ORF Transcript_8277/g.51575 Transcript_8277/m.51575 type:complete len:83 (+) Transcript_8277:3857-4105(+)